MVLKKQTVWLLSMLTILVVLSAYYLVQGPSQQVPVALNGKQAVPTDSNLDAAVQIKQTTEKAPITTPTDDYFISSKMQRDAQQEQEMDQFMEVISNGNAKPTVIAQAKKKYDELSSLYDNQTQVEELVKSVGHYKDALVIAKDDMVRVIVQANALTPDKVVEIISLVKQNMKVHGNSITVSYKP